MKLTEEESADVTIEKKPYSMEAMLNFSVKMRRRIALAGKKGTGKSTLAHKLAKESGLTLRTYVLTRETSEASLLGYEIEGRVAKTKLREAVENGGIILLEESDACDPNILVCLNSLESGYIDFPDARVETHPDFMIIETTNTFADGDYHSGKMVQDASVTDRCKTFIIDSDPFVSEKTLKIRSLLLKATTSLGITEEVSNRDYYRFDEEIKEFELCKELVNETLLHSFPKYDKERIENTHSYSDIFKPDIEDVFPDELTDDVELGDDMGKPKGNPKKKQDDSGTDKDNQEGQSSSDSTQNGEDAESSTKDDNSEEIEYDLA